MIQQGCVGGKLCEGVDWHPQADIELPSQGHSTALYKGLRDSEFHPKFNLRKAIK